MRTLLITLALLVTVSVKAESLPEGCYVAYANPGTCWVPADGFTEWIASTDRSLTSYRYGASVESIIYQWAVVETNRQEWVTYGTAKAAVVTKNAALIKKLRKACGSKCKRIK